MFDREKMSVCLFIYLFIYLGFYLFMDDGLLSWLLKAKIMHILPQSPSFLTRKMDFKLIQRDIKTNLHISL